MKPSSSRVARRFVAARKNLNQFIAEWLLAVHGAMTDTIWGMDWGQGGNPVIGSNTLDWTLYSYDVTGPPGGKMKVDKEVGVKIRLELVSLDRLEVTYEVFAGRPVKRGTSRYDANLPVSALGDQIIEDASAVFERAF